MNLYEAIKKNLKEEDNIFSKDKVDGYLNKAIDANEYGSTNDIIFYLSKMVDYIKGNVSDETYNKIKDTVDSDKFYDEIYRSSKAIYGYIDDFKKILSSDDKYNNAGNELDAIYNSVKALNKSDDEKVKELYKLVLDYTYDNQSGPYYKDWRNFTSAPYDIGLDKYSFKDQLRLANEAVGNSSKLEAVALKPGELEELYEEL